MSAPVGRNTRVATSSGLAGGGSGPGSPPASTGKLPASPWERSLFGGFSPVARNQPRSEAERGAFVIQVVGGRTTRTGCATPTMSVFTVRVDEAKVGEAECTLSARKGGGDERAPSQTIGDDASNLQKAKGVIGARPSLPVQQRLDRRA